MYPLTLQAQIMRHMLNLAKDMASGDLLESRKKSRRVPIARGPECIRPNHAGSSRSGQDVGPRGG
jgi:hypothetical protein